MAYRIPPLFPMTLIDLQGHSRILNLLRSDFPYSCAALNKFQLT